MTPETHTYRIRDTLTGREKVVHRNLLMLVSFLPLGDTVNVSDLASSPPGSDSPTLTTSDVEEPGEALLGRVSVALSGAGACPETVSSRDSPADVEKDQVPLNDLGPVDSEGRTIDWITRLSTPALSETSGDDVTSLTSDPRTSSVLPASALTDQTETAAEDVRGAVPALVAVTMKDNFVMYSFGRYCVVGSPFR